jgi:hypothetical protein
LIIRWLGWPPGWPPGWPRRLNVMAALALALEPRPRGWAGR